MHWCFGHWFAWFVFFINSLLHFHINKSISAFHEVFNWYSSDFVILLITKDFDLLTSVGQISVRRVGSLVANCTTKIHLKPKEIRAYNVYISFVDITSYPFWNFIIIFFINQWYIESQIRKIHIQKVSKYRF